jgi:hypothetical protein
VDKRKGVSIATPFQLLLTNDLLQCKKFVFENIKILFIKAIYLFVNNLCKMKEEIKAYTLTELVKKEDKNPRTIKAHPELYIPIRIESKRLATRCKN